MKAPAVRLATSALLGLGILAGSVLVEAPASAQTVRRTTTITTYRTRRPSSRWTRHYRRGRYSPYRYGRHSRRTLRTRRPLGDRDRDGVPNIVDRRPRNPTR